MRATSAIAPRHHLPLHRETWPAMRKLSRLRRSPPTTELAPGGRCKGQWKQALTTPGSSTFNRAIPSCAIDTPSRSSGPQSLIRGQAAVLRYIDNLKPSACS